MPRLMLPRRSSLKVMGGLALASSSLSTFGARPLHAATKDVDVVIVGAGLSGLLAACILEEQGKTVCVVEAKNYVGGRCYTFTDLPGNPEAGGSSVGAMYARFLDWAEKFGIKRTPLEMSSNPVFSFIYNIQGQTIQRQEWATHALNPFKGDDKKITPDGFRFRMLDRYNTFNDLESWREPKVYNADTSMYELFKAKGHSDAEIALGLGANPGYGHTPYDLSSTHMFHVANFARSQMQKDAPSFWEFEGGNQALPKAMAKSLKGDVFLNTPVSAVRTNKGNAEVIAADGRVFKGKSVLMSVPFSAMRFITFDPGLTGAQAEAVYTIPYGTCWHAYVSVKGKYWESDNMPVGIWSDSNVGRITSVREGNEVVGLYVFLTGKQAMRLNRLPLETAKSVYMDELHRVRPAMKGKVKMERAWSWVNDAYAGGMYAYWRPGMIAKFKDSMAKPYNNIYFCGEHTADSTRGLEGALESGERAAFEMLEKL